MILSAIDIVECECDCQCYGYCYSDEYILDESCDSCDCHDEVYGDAESPWPENSEERRKYYANASAVAGIMGS